jgi:predicted permease
MKYSELDGEMREHLNEKIADLMERGLTESEARAQALREFGNRTLHLEDSRAVWRWPSLDRLSSDLRYALRGMRRSPGFTAVVVATLALGIGANTAIFSLVNQLLLHPSGIANPERIVTVGTRYNKLGLHMTWSSPPTLADVRDSRQVFDHAALSMTVDVNYAEGDNPERLQAARVSTEWFDVFGVKPLLGRVFHPEEDQPNANRVAALSYAAWTRLFGRDRNVLGRTILLDQVAHQVIGVMTPGFRYPNNVDLWVPVGLPSTQFASNNRFNEVFLSVARAKPGVSFDQANAWMGVLGDRVRNSKDAAYVKNADWGLFAVPFTDSIAGNTKTPLLILLGAVGLVLLIACSNIAGLMLARASVRAREFAVRAALGAGSGRLLRLMSRRAPCWPSPAVALVWR